MAEKKKYKPLKKARPKDASAKGVADYIGRHGPCTRRQIARGFQDETYVDASISLLLRREQIEDIGNGKYELTQEN